MVKADDQLAYCQWETPLAPQSLSQPPPPPPPWGSQIPMIYMIPWPPWMTVPSTVMCLPSLPSHPPRCPHRHPHMSGTALGITKDSRMTETSSTSPQRTVAWWVQYTILIQHATADIRNIARMKIEVWKSWTVSFYMCWNLRVAMWACVLISWALWLTGLTWPCSLSAGVEEPLKWVTGKAQVKYTYK